ncbi:PAS domain-containing protein [Stakelama marina]|uniref:histidine kinase n=1 Tax=Stakelama marina TaxID=2826939 RepID=A0A8T4ILM1_9SPHN|nr:PAS domain-containing protein [Stakelama marina]MBR0553056.1 PAS domain-containing protein [Stakelama marina]
MLATVLDQTHDCVKILSLDGVIQYVNRQGAESMELSDPEELVGRRWIELWPEEARPKVEHAIDQARLGERERFEAFRYNIKGRPGWWDVTVAPVRDDDGTVQYLVSIARDATAEVAERDRADAISTEMRHRLKNSLTVAAGLLMLSARNKPEVQGFATAVAEKLGQLANLQAMLLERADNKNLREVIPELMKVYAEQSLIEFGTLPEIIMSDGAMQALALVFGELCTNSLKYGAMKNGLKVQVDARHGDGELCLDWVEPTRIAERRPGGQGHGLIERMLQANGGSVAFTEEGDLLRVQVRLPVPEIATAH